jgi:HrpA-like RNA helicase
MSPLLQALDRNQDLTALGHHLAMLPVDARVGKMLIHASVLGCLDPVLTIAAMLSTRSPFVAPLDKRDLADAAKKAFAVESGSDLMAGLRAFEG